MAIHRWDRNSDRTKATSALSDSGRQSKREHGDSEARLDEELVQRRQSWMIEIGEAALLTKNLDRRAPSALAGARGEASLDRVAVALGATHNPIERLDREGDAGEHNRANNPKLAHGAHRVRAGSKQFDDTSMP